MLGIPHPPRTQRDQLHRQPRHKHTDTDTETDTASLAPRTEATRQQEIGTRQKELAEYRRRTMRDAVKPICAVLLARHAHGERCK